MEKASVQYKVGKHLLFAIFLTLVLLLPDMIYAIYENHFLVLTGKTWRGIFAIFIVSMLILSIRSLKVKVIFFIFFTLMSFIELVHYAFFHGLLMHYEIMFFFTQFFEIQESVVGVLQYMILPVILWMIQIVTGYWLLVRSDKYTIKVRYTAIILVLLLSLIPYSAYKRSNISSMMPNNHTVSIINALNSVSLFIGKEIPKYMLKHKKMIVFKPYHIQNAAYKLPQNIIVVMGESLGSKHMHLFGAKTADTPHLDQLKKDKNFIYKKGYASGVDTLTAVPTFFLMKREPENVALLGNNATNLLHLAKRRGYKVHYFTTQKLNIMAPYVSDADVVKRFKGKDEVLIKALDTIDFSKKNFIILHQRNSHSPYEDSTPKRFYKYPFENKDFHTHMLHSYYNSILYTDYIIDEIISKVKKIPNSVMFMTSDHAEMMGLPEEGGRYGHAFLSKEVAKVPILIYVNAIDENLSRRYTDIECFNHYTLGKLVANSLGYRIENPNDEGHYYIQGTAIDGSNGFIEYNKAECEALNNPK